MGFEPVHSFTGGLSGILPFVLKTPAVLLTRLRIDQTAGLWWCFGAILVDAAEMGEAPGTIRWIGIGEIDGMSASTHTLLFSMLAKYMTLDLGCDVHILGIQPRSTDIGEAVSGETLLAVSRIVDGMVQSLSLLAVPEPGNLN